MKIIKFILVIIILSAPFIVNILRKNLYFTNTTILFELNDIIREKEREFEEIKSKYTKIFSPTYIESIGEMIGLKKPTMKDYLILE